MIVGNDPMRGTKPREVKGGAMTFGGPQLKVAIFALPASHFYKCAARSA